MNELTAEGKLNTALALLGLNPNITEKGMSVSEFVDAVARILLELARRA